MAEDGHTIRPAERSLIPHENKLRLPSGSGAINKKTVVFGGNKLLGGKIVAIGLPALL